MRKRNFLLTILVLVLTAGVCVGVAYARYISYVRKDLQIQHRPTPLLTLEGQQDQEPVWIRQGNQAKLEFHVKTEEEEECKFSLYLVVCGPVQENMQVTLTMADVEYTAQAEQIAPGTTLYEQVGSGYVIRFYTGQQEAVWDLGSASGYSRSFMLTASGMEKDTMLEVFVAQSR